MDPRLPSSWSLICHTGSTHPDDQGREGKGVPAIPGHVLRTCLWCTGPIQVSPCTGSKGPQPPEALSLEACPWQTSWRRRQEEAAETYTHHPHEATAWHHGWSGEGRARALCPNLTRNLLATILPMALGNQALGAPPPPKATGLICDLVPDPTQSGLAPCDASVPPTKMESHYQLLCTQGMSVQSGFPSHPQSSCEKPSQPGLAAPPPDASQSDPRPGRQPAGAFGLGEQSLRTLNLNPALAGSLLRGGSAGTDPSPVVSLSPHLPLLPSTSTSVQPEIQKERAVPPPARML